MNILIVSQYFWPEPFIINDLVINLQRLGHNITIFTGKPNYPNGEIYQGYNSFGYQQETYDENINVFRVPLKPRKTGGRINLFLNYASFVLSGLKYAIKFSKDKKFDSILVFAPSPITSAIPAIFIKKITKSHLSIWVQDLWPQSIKATGFVRNKFLLNCVKILVKVIYHFADTLLVQSKAFIPEVSKLAPKKEIIYYPNSAKYETFQDFKTNKLPENLDELLTNYFCVIFAGNIGIAQSIETIVAAAHLLKEIPDLKIILVGSGSRVEWVNQQIKNNNITNLILAGRFPSEFMPNIYSKAKVLLVTLKQDEIFTYTIPCKIQSYLAAGKPIIAALDGEGSKIIIESGAGFTSPSENAEELAKNIKKMYDLPLSNRDEMGKRGRDYFLKHFEMESQCVRLIEIFKERTQKVGKAK